MRRLLIAGVMVLGVSSSYVLLTGCDKHRDRIHHHYDRHSYDRECEDDRDYDHRGHHRHHDDDD